MATRTISWNKTLNARLGGAALALLALSLLLVVGNLVALSSLKGQTAWTHFAAGIETVYNRLLYLDARMEIEKTDDRRRDLLGQYQQSIDELDHSFEVLRLGDASRGIPAPTDPRILDNLRERVQVWLNQIKPALTAHLADRSNVDLSKGDRAKLDDLLTAQFARIHTGTDLARQLQNEAHSRFQMLQAIFGSLALLITVPMLWLVRQTTRRIHDLATIADRIAAGEVTLSAGLSGGDEIAALGEAFDTMTTSLRETLEVEKKRQKAEHLLANIREAVVRLASCSAEIVATTTAQAAGAQQQAAAVGETVTTVDEVAQTAAQGAQRAKGVGEAVQRSLEIGQAGRKAVGESIAGLDRLKEQVESTAENTLMLAEQAQLIGQIISTVNDIAEQTNMLALNAAIEASRAGEHGKGFAVVASEVKALADQSKKATGQISQILGEIQRATNTAVLSTEEVTKGVASAIRSGQQSGQTINSLADTLSDAASASTQIVASASQQAVGMQQINQAMRSLDQVARQNLAAMRQAEQAALNLNELGSHLAGLSAE
jgi:methyl-accepting chemotaxis protein